MENDMRYYVEMVNIPDGSNPMVEIIPVTNPTVVIFSDNEHYA